MIRLAINNFKKSKGQYITFGLMILLAAMFLNIAFILNTQMSKNYDKVFNELNTADINFAIKEDKNIYNDILNINNVSEVENHEAININVIIKNFNGTDFEMNTVFYNLDSNREINKIKIIEENDTNSIYIPLYVSQFGGFNLGDKIVYVINNVEYNYTVSGIVNEMQYGNFGTGMIGAYLHTNNFNELKNTYNDNVVYEYSIKTNDNIQNEIKEILNDNNLSLLYMKEASVVKQTRMMISNLITAILIAFALIILVVTLFLSVFRISNTIEEEMVQMGILKSIGFKNMTIILSVILPYLAITLIFSIIGIIISYIFIPSISNILAIQSGFSCKLEFNLIVLLLIVLSLVVIVGLFSYFVSRRIKRLDPIKAMKSINNKGSQNVILPIEKTRLNINVILVLKRIRASLKQNILLFLVSFVIMILLVFAGTLMYNVNIKESNFYTTLQEEVPSVIFESNNADELVNILKNDRDVKEVLKYNIKQVEYELGSIQAFICEDFTKVENDICYEGRNPINSNEIAIGSALSDKYKIGSIISITINNISHNYVVTGYIQSVNNNGLVCELLISGYSLISDDECKGINVYLNSLIDEDEFINKYLNNYSSLITQSTNYSHQQDISNNLYQSISSISIIMILVISILITTFVLYIIIKSMITRKKKEYGIYKAVGYSNRKLMIQTAFTFIPFIALGSILSAFLGLLYMKVIDNCIFRMVGAMKNNFEVSILMYLLFALLLIIASFIICIILARPIKKISPYSLLME